MEKAGLYTLNKYLKYPSCKILAILRYKYIFLPLEIFLEIFSPHAIPFPHVTSREPAHRQLPSAIRE